MYNEQAAPFLTTGSGSSHYALNHNCEVRLANLESAEAQSVSAWCSQR